MAGKKKIAHCCLSKSTLEPLKIMDDILFIQIQEPNLYPHFKDHMNTYDGLILGEEVKSPINTAQKIYSIDKEISILILASPPNYSKYKQALNFTPFIGNTIQCISKTDDSDLKEIVDELVKKTWQRRNYAKINLSVDIFGKNDHISNIKKQYLDKYLEKAPIGAVLMDDDGVILAANECTTEIFSIQQNEILGTDFSKLFAENEKIEVQDFIETGYFQNSKKLFKRNKDKASQFLEITLSPIAPTNSKYKIAILNDVTDKVENEKQIKLQVNQLETLNTRLVSINENLRSTNKELDTFIYTASHDLKAPILNIEGLTKVLEKELRRPGTKIKTILNLISKSIDRFKETIIDLTEVSKIQYELNEDVGKVKISDVIEEVKDLISDSISSNSAVINMDLSLAPEIVFSKKNLKSILYNLIVNSIKYRSPDRTPIVSITSSRIEQYIMLTFEDNGIGFDPEKKDRIFEMFKRLHNHVEGTGIGLYIVKKIVEQTGGKIEVDSKKNLGTTFKIFLKPQESQAG